MKSTGVPAHRKGFRRSDGWRRLKLAVKRLVGREPWLKADIRVPLERLDDWWVCLDLLATGQVVYSCGVGEDIGFELEIIRRQQVTVYAFDPTPNSATWLQRQQLPTRFQFYPWAVSNSEGEIFLHPRIRKDGTASPVMFTTVPEPATTSSGFAVTVKTLGSIMRELGHVRVDVLKLDIEGAEYAVLEDLLGSALRPVQILIEFHHRFPAIGKQRTLDAVSALRKAGYGLARISSSGREFTLILKSAAAALAVSGPPEFQDSEPKFAALDHRLHDRV